MRTCSLGDSAFFVENCREIIEIKTILCQNSNKVIGQEESDMNQAAELIKKLLMFSFDENNIEKAMDMLGENIRIFGIANDIVINGINEVKDLCVHDTFSKYKPYRLSFFDEAVIGEKNAEVGFSLTYKNITMEYRVTGTTETIKGEEKLVLLHFSVINPNRKPNIFEDISKEHIMTERQKLLLETVSGGMMGGYLEEGFPYYFIESRMISYLGYESEEDFVEHIQGFIENCMHPEDRDYVNSEVEKQLALSNTYQVEYRLQRKDGSYIWVHDVGRVVVAEDGRDAIISVCYDITKDREHSIFIEKMIDTMEGGFALFSVKEDWDLELLYASAGVGSISGRSEKEYESLCKESVLDSIYIQDRELVKQAYSNAVREDKVTNFTFRIPDKKEGYLWINGIFSKFGEKEGVPVLRAVFTHASIQQSLQIQALTMKSVGVYVVNAHTKELYYANDACFALHGLEPCDITGRFCYDVFHNEQSQCESCWLKTENQREEISPSVKTEEGKTLSITVEKKYWNEKDVLVVISKDVTKEVESAKLIQENERTLEKACRFANMWTATVNLKKRECYPDLYMQECYDMPSVIKNFPESIIIQGMVHPEDVDRYRDMIHNLSKDNQKTVAELRKKNTQGSYSWMRYYWNISEYKDGKPYKATGYARFIDQEMSQRARMELERERMLGGDKKLAAYAVTNLQSEIIEEGADYFFETGIKPGEKSEEGVKKLISHIYDDEDKILFQRMHGVEYAKRNYAKGITTWELELRWNVGNGFIQWQRSVTNVLKDPETNILYRYDYLYDIQAEKLLEEFVDGAVKTEFKLIGVLTLDERKFYTLIFEEGGARVQAVEYEDIRLDYIATEVSKEDQEMVREKNSFSSIVEYLNNHQGTYQIIHKSDGEDGKVRYKEISFSKINTRDDSCFCNVRDVTETVKREEQDKLNLMIALEQAEKATAAKTDFLARMSHDLRTPINTIVGLQALALDDVCSQEKVKDYLGKMHDATDFMLSLINDLLDMAEIENGKLELHKEPYKYSEFLENMKTMFIPQCENKGIVLSFAKPKINPTILVDKMKMNRIFFNIFSNAVKYTPEKGCIDYRIENLKMAGNHIWVDYIISDNGIGMSEEFQEHMFEAFAQEHHKMISELQGTGVGLSITKQLLEQMGGKIHISSKKGKGTTVTISMDFELLSEDDGVMGTRKDEKDGLSEDKILQEKNVLLVEDHPLNSQIAKKLLEKKGMNVMLAKNGEEAVHKFCHSKEGYYQVVLMDIRMPVMDGLEATKTIRSMNRQDAKKVPIIAMSANAYAEDRQKSFQAGMNEHLAKPVNPKELYQSLIKHLNS